MTSFSEKMGGFFARDDFEDFSVKIEKPEAGRFREYEIYTCGPWCQGPVVAQTLQMVEDDDLASMGHNSPDYVHLVSQALNLSFADRHYYYGASVWHKDFSRRFPHRELAFAGFL